MAQDKTAKPRPASKSQQSKLSEKALGPAAEEFGKAIAPLGADVGSTAALVGSRITGAIKGLVYGYDQVSEWLWREVSKRLESTPDEKIVEPDPRIAVPAIQALTYSMNEKHIRDMFANLLAADMVAETKKAVHPSFSSLVTEMTSLEAVVLTKLKTPQVAFRVRWGSANGWQDVGLHYTFAIADTDSSRISLSLNNLIRLGLVRETSNEWRNIPKLDEMEKEAKDRYAKFAETIQALPAEVRDKTGMPSGSLFVVRYGYQLSDLGQAFQTVCLTGAAPPT